MDFRVYNHRSRKQGESIEKLLEFIIELAKVAKGMVTLITSGSHVTQSQNTVILKGNLSLTVGTLKNHVDFYCRNS